ncbi:hypothetical protein [Thalassoglobus polymorphus]|nr:hypothetical protein [Thalassoglobus polymorphus]
MFTYQTLSRRLDYYTLDELLQIGLERARALQCCYEDWKGATPESVSAIESTLSNLDKALRGVDLTSALTILSEDAYTAAARAAAVYRQTRIIEAKHAQFAGLATHLLADAIVERARDSDAARGYAIQSIAATFKAEADGISFEPKTVMTR